MISIENQHPIRLMVAAHELGHAIAWRAGGWPIAHIRVLGKGARSHGETLLARTYAYGLWQRRSWLVGSLAGAAAGDRWCTEFNLPPALHERGCAADQADFAPEFRSYRAECAEDVTVAQLRAEAAAVIRTHWRAILRLAPRLAACGSLGESVLPTTPAPL